MEMAQFVATVVLSEEWREREEEGEHPIVKRKKKKRGKKRDIWSREDELHTDILAS